MSIKVCVAGATGWTGSAVAAAVAADPDFQLTAAVARKAAGTALHGATVSPSFEAALAAPFDVLIDYTKPDSVKARVLAAVAHKKRVIVGTSGLTAADYAEIDAAARLAGVGVIAAGNFSLTAALAKHFALIAARYLPARELIDYAGPTKVDQPSGTVRELAEALGAVSTVALDVPLDRTFGPKEARGATIATTQVHSVRLPGVTIAFEALFGQAHERLTIRHDAGASAAPYVAGTLLAAKRVMSVTGLIRGLDTLLFER
jgi:4-hydroxy-tetrahydrodipicolinate reductase